MFKSFYNNKLPLKYLFLLGALLGAVVFVGIYGVKVLDFTNTGWLFYGDNDLRQHYIAWCNYRKDPWHFPIGLIDSLSYPYSVSVIYSDSIPLFAVIFKLFSGILPETFQYFGLFGIMSFMLMGGFSAILIARFNDNNIIILLGSLFFSFSFQMIQRLFYHSALSAQWLIILAMILWVYDGIIKSSLRKIISWGVLGFLCVAIHSYFLPMVGMVMLALMISQFVTAKNGGETVLNSLKLPILEFVSFCLMAIFNLYILGAFYGEATATAGGLGTFNANLNTFINPIGYGKMLPRLPLYNDFQYEGFGYVGAGIIFLYVLIAIGLIVRRVRKVKEASFHSTRLYGRLTFGLFLCSWFCAMFPLFSYNDKKIVWLPVSEAVERIVGIFRSNGRLIWVATYILVLTAIIITAYTFREDNRIAIAYLCLALFVQVFDASSMLQEKYSYFSQDYEVLTIWDDPELTALTNDKTEFIFLYNDNDITLYTAYFGSQHGMRQNNYYFARSLDDAVNARIDENMAMIKEGTFNSDAVYVITDDMYFEDQDFYNNLDARKVFKYDHFYFTK